MKKTKRAFALRAILAASVSTAAMTSAAVAQDPAEESASKPKDEIVVTGSRIGRGALDAPQPLQQFTGDDIILSGEPNIVDYLADVPALQGSIVPEDTTGAGLGDGGLSLLNLRQLGSARTLVLVDGRRHVGASPGTSSVDVDGIPRLLIESVDVVTGANSAVYGADAVSGVVNFKLKDDFEGLTVDLGGASIAQGFEGYNYRASLLAGKNFFDDRMNIYVAAEYENSDEIKQGQLDLKIADSRIINHDLDFTGQLNDGIVDNLPVFGNLTTISRPTGGIFTLAHDIRQNGIQNNVNVPFVTCAAGSVTSGNCFIIDPPFSFLFGPGGSVITPNYGTFRSPTGSLRTTIQNGSGDPFSLFQASQLPEAEAMRFQSGLKFELTDNIEFFAEGKYVNEDVLDNFQPAFFDVQFETTGVAPTALTAPNQNTFAFPQPGGFLTSLNQFRLPIFNSAGNINPLIPASIVSAIAANTRTTYVSNVCSPNPITGLCTNANFYVPSGSVAHPVGQIRVFTTDYGDRPQALERTTYRAVGGFRGSMDTFGFIDNMNWEVGYTYGSVSDENREFGTIDVFRFANALDVVPNTAATPGLGPVGTPVCRIKVLAALGLFGFSPTDPVVSECIPGSLFGAGGLSATAPYVLTDLGRTNKNAQHDVLAFMSGDLFDLWGAGPVQFSLGGEWRREATQGTVDYAPTDPRTLFANTGLDFPKTSFGVKEGFFEARIPLLADTFIAQSLEVGGAVRVSDYSSIGTTTTWNTNAVWEWNDQVTLRGTYGVAVRAPNLSELFSPPGQTFLQITDPCSLPVILGTVDATIRNNRIANCAAQGIPGAYVDPNPASSNAGQQGGNPILKAEKSRSWTASIIYQPEWLDRFSMVVDFYGIEISDAIANPTIQALVNGCYDGNSLNPNFCSQFTRDPGTFEINFFNLSPVNFQALKARGIDYAFKFGFDLADDWGKGGLIPGSIDFSLRGSYVMHRVNFVNVSDPTDQTELDGTVGFPKNRFLVTTAWNYGKLRISHDLDYFTSMDFEEAESYIGNEDSGLQLFRKTGPFTQHDLTATYELNDNFSFRAGVVNLFDNEPPLRVLYDDLWDLWGRRYFIGATATF